MQLNDPASLQGGVYADSVFDSKDIVMGLHWDPPEKGVNADVVDLDALCVLFDRRGDKLEVVYPGCPRNVNGSVIHTGDSRTGASKWDDEQIIVFTEALPETVASLAFVVASVTGHAFNAVRGACCHVSDRATEREWVRMELTALDGDTQHGIATLRRHSTGWEISAGAQFAHNKVMAEVLSLVRNGKCHAS